MTVEAEALPQTDNGYKVVARCIVCEGYLYLDEAPSGPRVIRHTDTFKPECRRTYAVPDRLVPEEPTPAQKRRARAIKSIQNVLNNPQAGNIAEVLYERAGRDIADSWADIG